MNITRRTAIAGVAALSSSARAASVSFALPSILAPTKGLPALVPVPAGKHRYQQPQLFQGAPSRYLVDGGALYEQDISGPTYLCVSTATNWRWDRPGSDWLDRDGLRHGPTPWASAPSVGGAVSVDGVYLHDVRTVNLDVTGVVSSALAADRWLALLLTATGAARGIAGRTHPTQAPPVIRVVYEDGTTATLICSCASDAAQSTANSPGSTSQAIVGCPAFLEFERPRGKVRSATLALVVVEHWSGNEPQLHAWLLDPPTAANDPVLYGLAQAYPLDADIASAPGVIGAHNYRDGEVAPIVPGAANIHNDGPFSKHFWNEGPRDVNLLPDRGLGKWINLPDGAAVVPSTHVEAGYAPLAPGLGALRLHMPGRNLKRGDIVGSSGDLACTAAVYLPEDIIGLQKRMFVRYYTLIAPFTVTPASRVLVRHNEARPATATAPAAKETWQFTTLAGKTGIAHSHDTSWGGVSGSSGGPYGWQMRASWYMNHSPGPDNAGLVMGHHLYDYYQNNPAGHNYGRDENSWMERWGRNGLGVIYPGHWYCVETELDLNSLTDGWKPDGALRTWIDGKLAYERTGMVFRSAPVYQAKADQRPMRELGIRNLWFDWFHGGRTLNTVPQTTYYAALVWSTKYIGPMKLS